MIGLNAIRSSVPIRYSDIEGRKIGATCHWAILGQVLDCWRMASCAGARSGTDTLVPDRTRTVLSYQSRFSCMSANSEL